MCLSRPFSLCHQDEARAVGLHLARSSMESLGAEAKRLRENMKSPVRATLITRTSGQAVGLASTSERPEKRQDHIHSRDNSPNTQHQLVPSRPSRVGDPHGCVQGSIQVGHASKGDSSSIAINIGRSELDSQSAWKQLGAEWGGAAVQVPCTNQQSSVKNAAGGYPRPPEPGGDCQSYIRKQDSDLVGSERVLSRGLLHFEHT